MTGDTETPVLAARSTNHDVITAGYLALLADNSDQLLQQNEQPTNQPNCYL